MPEIIENTPISENCEIVVEKNRSLHDDNKINGYVTVIKNKGKWNEKVIQKDKPNLLTNDGLDFFHNQVYVNTGPGTQAGNEIALSTDTSAPLAADTVLANEIGVGAGLERKSADSSVHGIGTNLTTMTVLFSATGIQAGIAKSALFNDDTTGIMTHEALFVAPVDLQNGDTLTVVWTLTLG